MYNSLHNLDCLSHFLFFAKNLRIFSMRSPENPEKSTKKSKIRETIAKKPRHLMTKSAKIMKKKKIAFYSAIFNSVTRKKICAVGSNFDFYRIKKLAKSWLPLFFIIEIGVGKNAKKLAKSWLHCFL